MTNLYRHRDWVRFRSEVIKLHGGRCARCDRSAALDGVVLQVHHKQYVTGRKPWEYGHIECEALCKGCHAEEHGKIMPQSGWGLLASDDLGDLSGNCELCGTELRYIFAIEHPSWGAMAVGTDCCDKLTMTTEASEYHDRYIKLVNMRKRFVGSSKWKQTPSGFFKIKRAGIAAFIFPNGNKFRIGFDGVEGKVDYDTLLDAKLRIFEFIESGEAATYLANRKKKLAERLRRKRGF